MSRSKTFILLIVLTISSVVTSSLFSALPQENAGIGWTGINPAASPIWVVHRAEILMTAESHFLTSHSFNAGTAMDQSVLT